MTTPTDIETAEGPEWSLFARWRYALKPASWPKVLVPAVLGVLLGAAVAGRFDATAALFTALFTAADVVFIVCLNDWADESVDRIKRRMFPAGCSPKTLPDGILTRRALLLAGLGAGGVALAIAVVAERVLQREGVALGGVALLSVFALYSLPPARLNYRGGGELLEALGLGLLLPLFGAWVQAPEAVGTAVVVLGGYTCLSFASAVASGLSDERSDREGGKRTLVTAFGNARARRVCEQSATAGVVYWLCAPLLAPGLPTGLAPLWGAVVAAWSLRDVRRLSDAAVTDAFAEQAAYKQALHRAIWRSGLVLGAGAFLRVWVRA